MDMNKPISSYNMVKFQNTGGKKKILDSREKGTKIRKEYGFYTRMTEFSRATLEARRKQSNIF